MVRTITIYLREFDSNIKTWMIEEIQSRINNRYKQSHIAEDIGVTNTQMSRFLNDHTQIHRNLSQSMELHVVLVLSYQFCPIDR